MPCWPQTPLPPEEESSCEKWYYCRWAWHVTSLWVRLLFCQIYPSLPNTPSMLPGRGIWWPRVVLTEVLLTWAHVLVSAIDHLVCYLVISLQLTVCRITSSLQYTIFSCQEYVFSSVKLSQFLQYFPKYALLNSTVFTAHWRNWCRHAKMICRGIWWLRLLQISVQFTWAHIMPHGTGIYTNVKVDRAILLLIFIFFSHFLCGHACNR